MLWKIISKLGKYLFNFFFVFNYYYLMPKTVGILKSHSPGGNKAPVFVTSRRRVACNTHAKMSRPHLVSKKSSNSVYMHTFVSGLNSTGANYLSQKIMEQPSESKSALHS